MGLRTLNVAMIFTFLISCGDDGPVRCEGNDDCTLPSVCVVDTCQAPEPAAEGEPCAHADHCLSGLCVVQSATSRPAPGPDSGVAGSDGGVADGGVSDLYPADSGGSTLLPGWGRCATRCGAAADCAADQRCMPIAGRAVEKAQESLMMLCRPQPAGDSHLAERCAEDVECRDGICEAGRCARACEDSCPAQMRCVPSTISRGGATVDQSLCQLEPSITVMELGSVDTPIDGTNELTFDLPEGITSMVVYAIDEDDLRVGIRKLTAPDGSVLINAEDPKLALQKTGPYIGAGSAVVPGSDAVTAPLQAGTYRVEIGTYDPQVFDKLVPMDGDVNRVAVALRRKGLQGGVIDLNLHFAPGTGISADKAKDDPYVKATMERVRGLLQRNLGVTFGELRYFDLTKDQDVLKDGNAARSTCREFARPGAGQAVNLVFIKDLGFTVGFAGGVGAPPAEYGLPASCIVLEKHASSNSMGVVTSHEMGHLLGLWHTTEISGGQDPIGDTPVCPPNTNTKECPDYRNLMFPIFPTNDPLVLSPAQRFVARGNPWLYENVLPDACGGRAVIDVSQTAFAGGDTVGSGDDQGSCGGQSHGERVHLFRLEKAAAKLRVRVTSPDFNPVVYLRRDHCAAADAEVGCKVGAGVSKELSLEVLDPAAGAYYLTVDAEDGMGFYTISVEVTAKPTTP